MKALFGSRGNRLRSNRDAVEFALDLTAEAITLHERTGQGGWKKFASARLDDPEFPMVIGLLRGEAEAQMGGRGPVRLWLPGEQVLMQRARIAGTNPAARHRAAFDYVARETVYRPEDVALAVAPAGGDGETALLITFAATWREARDYAARWGFVPGEVSTRHHAGDFGPEGPVFHLNSPPPERTAPLRRSRLAVAALALAAVAAGAVAWSQRPWETPSAQPGTALEVAEAPAPPRSPAPESPQAAPLPAPEPETRVQAPPPEHFPHTPVLTPPGAASQRPQIGAAPQALSPPAAPDALGAPAALAAAPLPPPDPEPAPPERDPVAAWTGPVPALEAPGLSSAPSLQAISGKMDPPAWVDGISLLAKGASPPPAPMAAPPAEPADVAEAAPPVPVPLPRPAYTDPYAPTQFASLTSPLPATRPARAAGPALARTALIGIHSLTTGRKALLRLANGGYRSVAVGDVVDGWRVSMIGADAMRVSRSGEDRTFPLVNR